MRKWLMAMVFVGVLVLAGCSGGPVQDDILNYINEEMDAAQKLESEAVSAYESVSGANYQDDQTMYDAMVNEVLPNYTEFIQELESVNIETEELQEIHQIYITGAELQQKGFEKIIEAIENQDAGMIEEANQMLNEGRAKIEDYQNKLDELAKDNNVEIEKN